MKRVDYLIQFLDDIFAIYYDLKYTITKLPIAEYGSHAYSVKIGTKIADKTVEEVVKVTREKRILTLVAEDYCELDEVEFVMLLLVRQLLSK